MLPKVLCIVHMRALFDAAERSSVSNTKAVLVSFSELIYISRILNYIEITFIAIYSTGWIKSSEYIVTLCLSFLRLYVFFFNPRNWLFCL